MKLITAIVRPTALSRVTSALRKAKVGGVIVSKVEGFGREMRESDLDLVGHLNPIAKIQVAAEPEDVDRITKLIDETVSRNDKDKGGIILVSNLDNVIRMGDD